MGQDGGRTTEDPRAIAELTTPTYGFKGDQFLIEPKEEIKKRLGRSPDLADALALTFAYPVTPKPATAGIGAPQTSNDYDPYARLN